MMDSFTKSLANNNYAMHLSFRLIGRRLTVNYMTICVSWCAISHFKYFETNLVMKKSINTTTENEIICNCSLNNYDTDRRLHKRKMCKCVIRCWVPTVFSIILFIKFLNRESKIKRYFHKICCENIKLKY